MKNSRFLKSFEKMMENEASIILFSKITFSDVSKYVYQVIQEPPVSNSLSFFHNKYCHNEFCASQLLIQGIKRLRNLLFLFHNQCCTLF